MTRVFGAADPGRLDAHGCGVLAYALQIYFDFCGYSDMAVGLGLMLGFEFPQNFNSPYKAESITDFWRRWHISLSSVLRDYLYIPLGGNRHGATRTYAEPADRHAAGRPLARRQVDLRRLGRLPRPAARLRALARQASLYQSWPHAAADRFTFLLMLFSWVLFRADNLAAPGIYFGAMFGLSASSRVGSAWPPTSTPALPRGHGVARAGVPAGAGA